MSQKVPKVDGSLMVTFMTSPFLLQFETHNLMKWSVNLNEVVVTFLIILGGHMNILFIIK